jgi:hypothetical protein
MCRDLDSSEAGYLSNQSTYDLTERIQAENQIIYSYTKYKPTINFKVQKREGGKGERL